MLNGKELGKAIAEAIRLKIASGKALSKKEIAIHFGVQPPSIHDWIKKGSISKDKLPRLWEYFSDVVGPDHWGLKKIPYSNLEKDPVVDSTTGNEKHNIDLSKYSVEKAGAIEAIAKMIERMRDDEVPDAVVVFQTATHAIFIERRKKKREGSENK